MKSVTIPKTEYDELKTRAIACERVVTALERAFSMAPQERSKRKVVSEFKKTNKYSKEFLVSLERGLARSSYFKA